MTRNSHQEGAEGSPTASPLHPSDSAPPGLGFYFLKAKMERKGVHCDKNGEWISCAGLMELFEVSRNFGFKHWQELPLETSTWPSDYQALIHLCPVAE